MKYAIMLTSVALLNIPLQIAFWWKVFGLWPASWRWFIAFSLLFYAQAEFAKWLVKKFSQEAVK